jgi:hypothetical protein
LAPEALINILEKIRLRFAKFSTLQRFAALQRQNSRLRAQTVAFAGVSLACRVPRKIFKIAPHEANFPIFMVMQRRLAKNCLGDKR